MMMSIARTLIAMVVKIADTRNVEVTLKIHFVGKVSKKLVKFSV